MRHLGATTAFGGLTGRSRVASVRVRAPPIAGMIPTTLFVDDFLICTHASRLRTTRGRHLVSNRNGFPRPPAVARTCFGAKLSASCCATIKRAPSPRSARRFDLPRHLATSTAMNAVERLGRLASLASVRWSRVTTRELLFSLAVDYFVRILREIAAILLLMTHSHAPKKTEGKIHKTVKLPPRVSWRGYTTSRPPKCDWRTAR
jgi:hypothetical protein